MLKNTKATFSDTTPGGNGGGSGWTYLPPGNGTAGSSATTGGAASGGVPAHAGMAGSAGVGGSVVVPPVTFKCGGKQPNQTLITNFDGFTGDRWASGNLDGGVYIYPDGFTPKPGEFLRFQDDVKTYTGMGVWFSGCIDGSKFSGVRFTISGDIGLNQNALFYVISNRDKEVTEANGVGACVPDDPTQTWLTCQPPTVTLPVTATPTTHDIPWSAFKAGLPTPTTDGSDLLALQWSFPWSDGNLAFPGVLTVDNVEFYSDDAAGGAGGGGAGGAPDTGNEGGAPASAGAAGQAVN